ncbi:MAG: phosphatidate cytidylyltransferase [Muribaculaceae bacterium]|nr:phosphatidate cytidylyltransferase [Muribaculaceae bacterium]
MQISSLIKRSISGGLYVAIIILAILGGAVYVDALALVFAFLAITEFFKISHGNIIDIRSIPGLILDIVLGLIIVISPLFSSSLILPVSLFLALFLFRNIVEIYSKNSEHVKNIALSFFSQIYIGVPFLAMLLIVEMSGSTLLLLPIFIMIWLNDTGAFIVGSLIGRNSLFKRISPNKSWEGFWGGMLFAVIVGVLFFCFWSQPEFKIDTLSGWIILSVIVSVFSTWGDLFESLIKRSLNIKDSGNLIPGHGGILDRIDSLLFVMPAVVLFLYFILNQ